MDLSREVALGEVQTLPSAAIAIADQLFSCPEGVKSVLYGESRASGNPNAQNAVNRMRRLADIPLVAFQTKNRIVGINCKQKTKENRYLRLCSRFNFRSE